jgi:hypothetical protein
MRYWWVNQNQTYHAEVRGNFMWSPKTNANGARNQFYDNMRLVVPGDIVFSFCDTRIKAVGVVTGTAQTAPKPDFGGAGLNWSKPDADFGPTFREQLVKARRGQGVFPSNSWSCPRSARTCWGSGASTPARGSARLRLSSGRFSNTTESTCSIGRGAAKPAAQPETSL